MKEYDIYCMHFNTHALASFYQRVFIFYAQIELSSSYTLHLRHQPMYGQLMTSYAILWQQPANISISFCIRTK